MGSSRWYHGLDIHLDFERTTIHMLYMYLIALVPVQYGRILHKCEEAFHKSEGRVKILVARVQYPVLHGNYCNKSIFP